jgi:hypothetical protein
VRVPRHFSEQGEPASAREKQNTASWWPPVHGDDEDDPLHIFFLAKRYVGWFCDGLGQVLGCSWALVLGCGGQVSFSLFFLFLLFSIFCFQFCFIILVLIQI